MMKKVVYLNGSYIPLSQAKLSLLSPGFLYGWGLFETMRAYNGKVFLLSSHIRRLIKSAEKIHIPVPFSQKLLAEAAEKTVKLNGYPSASVRITLWLGETQCGKVAVFVQPYRPPKGYNKGWRALVVRARKEPSSVLTRIKSSCFLEHLLARKEVHRRGCEEGLFLNTRGELTEGTVTNLFIVKRGTVLTPPPCSGILSGITRGVIFLLAKKLGISIRERKLFLKDLWEAEESFLTNSLIEVMPLVTVNARKVGQGIPGPLTKRLRKAYKDYVKEGTEKKLRD